MTNFVGNLPSIANTGNNQIGTTSSANLIAVTGLGSGANNLMMVNNVLYFGGPNNPANANGALSDGFQWIEAANIALGGLTHGDLEFDTSSFNYGTLYLYAMLGGPRLTQQPNTGINTRIPFTP